MIDRQTKTREKEQEKEKEKLVDGNSCDVSLFFLFYLSMDISVW